MAVGNGRINRALTGRPAADDAPGMRALMIQHLTRKRDTVLELMRAGDIYPLAPVMQPLAAKA